MSFLNFGRQTPASPADVARQPWWEWNPARHEAVPSTSPEVGPDPWRRWNPYRRTRKQVEAQGRREGYVEGVRDEQRVVARRERRRGHPVLALVVFIGAVSGIGFFGLAYETGSFTGGGAVIDQKIGEWRADLTGAAGRAGEESGHAVQNVGRSISSQSRQLTQTGR